MFFSHQGWEEGWEQKTVSKKELSVHVLYKKLLYSSIPYKQLNLYILPRSDNSFAIATNCFLEDTPNLP